MIVAFSIFLALYIAKINGLTAHLQFTFKQRKITKIFGKGLSCTACLSFWTALGASYYYNLPYDMYVLNCVTSYSGGSFVERVWLKL